MEDNSGQVVMYIAEQANRLGLDYEMPLAQRAQLVADTLRQYEGTIHPDDIEAAYQFIAEKHAGYLSKDRVEPANHLARQLLSKASELFFVE